MEKGQFEAKLTDPISKLDWSIGIMTSMGEIRKYIRPNKVEMRLTQLIFGKQKINWVTCKVISESLLPPAFDEVVSRRYRYFVRNFFPN